MSNMFTKSIFNVCKLQFVSKYVCKLHNYECREGPTTSERPAKIILLLSKQSSHSSRD